MGLIDFKFANSDEDKPMLLQDMSRFDEVSVPMYRLIIKLGLYTGMSLDEIVAIKNEDLDERSNTISVYSLQQKRTRTVYLSNVLMGDLLAYRKKAHIDSSFIFSTTRQNADLQVKDWTIRLLGTKKSWLAIRRTYLIYCANHGIDILVASENSGVPVASITSYFTKSPEQKRKMINGENNGRKH